MSSIHSKRTICRACGEKYFRLVLSLGPMPLANSFLKPTEFAREPSFPLDLYFCEACAMVQLLDVINPEVLFRNYLYVTGTSDTMVVHNKQYAKDVVDMLDLQPSDLVIEVASNDGSLLYCFQEYALRVLGIEPASNIAKMANATGVETLDIFFNSHTAIRVLEKFGKARAVVANNVLAHVDETLDFMMGCKSLLANDGLLVIEVPYLKEMLDRVEFDTIYHEHLSYFSIDTLRRLCESIDLSLIRIDHVPVHGGSLRIYAGLGRYWGGHAKDVLVQIEAEKTSNMANYDRLVKFAEDVKANRQALRELLISLKASGNKLAAYGAPAKGNTLLNYCGISTDLVAYTVDKNPLKVGLHTPGMHLPVLGVDSIIERQPDYVLILAWNFAAEIIRQQEEYHRRGGKFILPIPEAKVIG
jgi:hypothetical protein